MIPVPNDDSDVPNDDSDKSLKTELRRELYYMYDVKFLLSNKFNLKTVSFLLFLDSYYATFFRWIPW